MTINEFLNCVPDMKDSNGIALQDTLRSTCEIWNNSACKGYCILAMQKTGYNRNQIRDVLSALRWEFDEVSVKQAEEAYVKF